MRDELLLVFLIGIIASANDIDLATNQNILLLLLLILFISEQNEDFTNCRNCNFSNRILV